jgi:hypothetical protein
LKENAHDLIHFKNINASQFTSAELVTLIKHADYDLHRQLQLAEENLAQVQSHFSQVAESLDSQRFWNNTKKLSEDLFQDYFNITMQV